VLEPNEIGFCNLATAAPVALDPYELNRSTGAFILIDRISARTVAAGMVAFPLRRAGNVRQQRFGVDKAFRAHMKAQRPCILWFTGLPGAGKSTIMNLVEQRLAERGVPPMRSTVTICGAGSNTSCAAFNASYLQAVPR
jgi:bifunctional enzyme CysN/CysC